MRSFVLLVAALLATVAFAIDPPKPANPPPATEQKAEEPVPAAERPDMPPLPADALPSGPPPARFNPTEKVRADFPVSFPIDI
jgi:hypothetical protein